jgi:hypothetical protein
MRREKKVNKKTIAIVSFVTLKDPSSNSGSGG